MIPQSLRALEVKSGKQNDPKGLASLCNLYPDAKAFNLGPQGMPFDEFFRSDPKEFF
jgi:hypothetical protein